MIIVQEWKDDRFEEHVLNKPNDRLKKLYHRVYSVEVQVEMVENDEFHIELDLLNAEKNIH